MKKEHEIKAILDQVQPAEGAPVLFESATIAAEYQRAGADTSGIAIKVLTVFGGMLATLAFLGFLVVGGLYNSAVGLLTVGLISIVCGVLLKKIYNKLIIDTAAVSLFVIGFCLLGAGLGEANASSSNTCILFILIAACTLAIIQNYILAFIAVLIINGSIMALILINDVHNLIYVYIVVLVVALTYFILEEATMITAGKKISRLYNPVRIGLIVSFIGALVLTGQRWPAQFSIYYTLFASLASIAAILYLTPAILAILQVQRTKEKLLIYTVTVLVLLPAVLAPAIPGALLIILLCFMVNHKTGLALGIVSFVYFISQYYYDLEFTLLTKSMLLLASGILFILFYLLTNKKLEQHEKI